MKFILSVIIGAGAVGGATILNNYGHPNWGIGLAVLAMVVVIAGVVSVMRS